MKPRTAETQPATAHEAMNPTPYELASLSAQLTQAGIIKNNERQLTVAAAALRYLDTCAEALRLREQDQAARELDGASQDRLAAFLAPFPDDGAIPVAEIVNHCNAARIVPSAAELAAVGIRAPWEKLGKQERAEAVFLVLTARPRSAESQTLNAELRATLHNSTFPAPSLKTARAWCKAGVPVHSAARIVRLIEVARASRAAEKGAEGAAKKKRKPRAPRGLAGEFEPKRRNRASGKFQRQ